MPPFPPHHLTISSNDSEWHDASHHEPLWRQKAQELGFCLDEDDVTVVQHRYKHELSQSCASRYYDDMASFYDLCRKRWTLDSHWGRNSAPNATSTSRRTLELFPSRKYFRPSLQNEDVWRIKLDPVGNYFIEALRLGGIRTIDIDTGEVLWSTPSSEARNCPHLECQDGWMVIEHRELRSLAVWQSERISPSQGASPRRGAYRRCVLFASRWHLVHSLYSHCLILT